MTLARITLDSGRDIELTELKISSTYGGLLEGYPNARMAAISEVISVSG